MLIFLDTLQMLLQILFPKVVISVDVEERCFDRVSGYEFMSFESSLFDLSILLMLSKSGSCSRCVLAIHIFALI